MITFVTTEDPVAARLYSSIQDKLNNARIFPIPYYDISVFKVDTHKFIVRVYADSVDTQFLESFIADSSNLPGGFSFSRSPVISSEQAKRLIFILYYKV